MTTLTLPARTSNPPSWSGMLPVDDTALYVTDTGGTGRPVVYLNGSYADMSHWRPVIRVLGTQAYRHICFDECARGQSRTSLDYSFEACLRDVKAVLRARGLENQKPILVGWSYGAYLGLFLSERHPELVGSVVAVDGGMPYGLTGEEGETRLRALFHKFRFFFPVASRLGLAARMSAEQHADINVEINKIAATQTGPVLHRVKVPIHFVLGTGGNIGSNPEEMEMVRDSLAPYLAMNPHLKVSAKVPANHGNIIKKNFAEIAQAVRELARQSQA